MSEEAKVNAAPKKKNKKLPIILGVVAVVLVCAGAGFWVWHEQPSFCAAICHTPMDEYLATYEQEKGAQGVDKWGNEVADTSSMIAVSHANMGSASADCLTCHVPQMSEQITEGLEWVSGNYTYPLEERTLSDLTAARGIEGNQFCMNDTCHTYGWEGLAERTADMERNPHSSHLGELECSSCHKAHRASVNYCTQCHNDAEVPEGWLSAADAAKLQGADLAAKA